MQNPTGINQQKQIRSQIALIGACIFFLWYSYYLSYVVCCILYFTNLRERTFITIIGFFAKVWETKKNCSNIKNHTKKMFQAKSKIVTFSRVADVYIVGYDTGHVEFYQIMENHDLSLIQEEYLNPRSAYPNIISNSVASDDYIFISAFNSKYVLTGTVKDRKFQKVKFDQFILPSNATFSKEGKSLVATSVGDFYRHNSTQPGRYVKENIGFEGLYCNSIQKQFSGTNLDFPKGLYLQFSGMDDVRQHNTGLYKYEDDNGRKLPLLNMVMPGVHDFSFSMTGNIATINKGTRLAQVRNEQGCIILNYQLAVVQNPLFSKASVTWLSSEEVMFDYQVENEKVQHLLFNVRNKYVTIIDPDEKTTVKAVEGYSTNGIPAPLSFQDSNNMVHLYYANYEYWVTKYCNTRKDYKLL
jgi:hypothetical protein